MERQHLFGMIYLSIILINFLVFYIMKLSTIKLLSISILGIYYFFGGIFISETIEYILPKYKDSEYQAKQSYYLLLEILISVCVIVIFVYFLRFIIKKLPLPLKNLKGFTTNKLLEINGTVILAYALFFNMKNLKFKLIELSKRIDNFIYKKPKLENFTI